MPKFRLLVGIAAREVAEFVGPPRGIGGAPKSSSILSRRLSGEWSARKASISEGVGNVPVRSMLTRRRNSVSVQIAEGWVPSLHGFVSMNPSIFVRAALGGRVISALFARARITGRAATPLS